MMAPMINGSIHHSSPHRVSITSKSPTHMALSNNQQDGDGDGDVVAALGELKITPKDLHDEPGVPRLSIEPTQHTLLDATREVPTPSPSPPKSYRPGSGGTAEDDACNLFIGDLARSVTEDQIRERFAGHGEIINFDIKRDKLTHNNLGYGFVQFKTKEQAQAAKKAMNGIELGNRVIRLGWAQKNTTLFIGDLDGTVTTEQLQDAFKEFGPLILEETFVKAGSGKYGFVRFQNRCDAERAKQEMNRKVIGTRQCRIGWGENNVQKHCVHVQFNPNMGPTLTEQMLTQFFSQFGTIVNVSLPRYANNKHKGYAFVHYPDGEEGETAAHNAISSVQDSSMYGVPIHLSYGKKQATTQRRAGSTSSNGSAGGGGTGTGTGTGSGGGGGGGSGKFKSRGSASSTGSTGSNSYKHRNSIQQAQVAQAQAQAQVQAQANMFPQQSWMGIMSPQGWQPIPVPMNAYQQQMPYYQQDGGAAVYMPQYYASTPTSNGATSPGFTTPNVFFQAASPYGSSYPIPEASPISPAHIQQQSSPVYAQQYPSAASPFPYAQQASPAHQQNNIYATTAAASVR